MFLVTGGLVGSFLNKLDSTETFDLLLGSWTKSEAKLPRPMDGLKAEIIKDKFFLFGNDNSLFLF